MLIRLGCAEVSRGGVVRMVVLESGDQGRECDAESPGLRRRCLVLAMALPLLICCVVLGKSLSLSGP